MAVKLPDFKVKHGLQVGGDANFSNIGKGVSNDKLNLADMSSRTPFARMWTAVELYWSQPDIFGEDYGMVEFEIDPTVPYSLYDTKWRKKINKANNCCKSCIQPTCFTYSSFFHISSLSLCLITYKYKLVNTITANNKM